jgi:hypothetical protein
VAVATGEALWARFSARLFARWRGDQALRDADALRGVRRRDDALSHRSRTVPGVVVANAPDLSSGWADCRSQAQRSCSASWRAGVETRTRRRTDPRDVVHGGRAPIARRERSAQDTGLRSEFCGAALSKSGHRRARLAVGRRDEAREIARKRFAELSQPRIFFASSATRLPWTRQIARSSVVGASSPCGPEMVVAP